jgi:hypothetical protein
MQKSHVGIFFVLFTFHILRIFLYVIITIVWNTFCTEKTK